MPYIKRYVRDFPKNNPITHKPKQRRIIRRRKTMKFFVRYKYSKTGKPSSWNHAYITVNATSDLMAEKIVQGRHPGYFVEIESIEEK